MKEITMVKNENIHEMSRPQRVHTIDEAIQATSKCFLYGIAKLLLFSVINLMRRHRFRCGKWTMAKVSCELRTLQFPCSFISINRNWQISIDANCNDWFVCDGRVGGKSQYKRHYAVRKVWYEYFNDRTGTADIHIIPRHFRNSTFLGHYGWYVWTAESVTGLCPWWFYILPCFSICLWYYFTNCATFLRRCIVSILFVFLLIEFYVADLSAVMNLFFCIKCSCLV